MHRQSAAYGPPICRIPYLINLVLEGDVHPELIGIHCGQ